MVELSISPEEIIWIGVLLTIANLMTRNLIEFAASILSLLFSKRK